MAKPLPEISARHKDRNTAIIVAYKTGAYSQPLRIEFAGVLCHITARDNARQDTCGEDADCLEL